MHVAMEIRLTGNNNKLKICIAHTHTHKERALGAWDKNETWIAYKGQKDKQHKKGWKDKQQWWWLIQDRYRKHKEKPSNKELKVSCFVKTCR